MLSPLTLWCIFTSDELDWFDLLVPLRQPVVLFYYLSVILRMLELFSTQSALLLPEKVNSKT
jgi:hypothetical protein